MFGVGCGDCGLVVCFPGLLLVAPLSLTVNNERSPSKPEEAKIFSLLPPTRVGIIIFGYIYCNCNDVGVGVNNNSRSRDLTNRFGTLLSEKNIT